MPVKLAARVLSRNNELGLYMPRSLRSAGLRPWGSLPCLVAAVSSTLVRRHEDPKTRLGAGRGLLLWISLSVALLSGSGLKLKLIFLSMRAGGTFSRSSRFLPSGSRLVWDSCPSTFPRKAPREPDRAKRTLVKHVLALRLVLTS